MVVFLGLPPKSKLEKSRPLINKHMPKQGPRPHTWKVPGEIPHKQHLEWQRMRAQARFRGEVFALTFEEYQQLWLGLWQRKGRGADDLCMVRDDPEGGWILTNCQVIPRIDHLRRQRQLYKDKRKWQETTMKS